MTRFKILFIISLIFTFIINNSAFSQSVKTDRGTVEFVGLQNWTLSQVTDSLKIIAPNQSLHFCAAVLKHDIGFAEADVTQFMSDTGLHSIVTVVEPADSNFVNYVKAPNDTLDIPATWKPLVDSLRSNRSGFDTSFQLYDWVLKGQPDSAYAKLKRGPVSEKYGKSIWNNLQKLNTPSDKMRAIWHLNNDGNPYHRTVAASILTNFAQDDAVWWNLVHALRSEDVNTVFASLFALRTLTQSGEYSIDWSPAVQDIKYLLQGTNTLAFQPTMELLSKTKISPSLAANIFSDSYNLVLSYQNLNYEHASKTAQDFLAQISDKEFTTNEEWKSWLSQFNK